MTDTAVEAHRLGDRLLIALVDGVVVAFAWFTVLAHLWDILNARVWSLLLVWVLTLPLPLVALARLRDGAPRVGEEQPAWLLRLTRARLPNRRLVLLFAALAVAGSALLGSTSRSLWRAGWALALVAVVAGLATVVLTRAPSRESEAADIPATRTSGMGPVSWGLVLAVVTGVVFVLGSIFTVSPTADDAYYVNRVAWIAQHGSIPDRDTMFSNNVFPPLYYPAIGTFETLAGGLAHVIGVSGPTMDYLVLGPLLLGLVPLVLWRTLLGLRLRRPALGLLAAIAFLLFTARGPQWFGLMVLRRPWQTKEILAAAMIPLLYTYGALCARRPGVRNGALLVAATVAALGFSSSAAALAPLVLLACGVAAYLCCGVRVVWPFAAALVYPVGCLLAYRFGGTSAANATTGNPVYKVPYDVWHWFIGDGLVGFVAGAALVAGYLGSRSHAARLMLGAGCLVAVVALAPGLLDVGGPLLGGAPTAWRVLWVAPLPVLVAGAVSSIDGLGTRLGGVLTTWAMPVVTVGLVVALVAFETPIWSARRTTFTAHPRWDVDPAALSAARHLIALAPPGSTVAGPGPVASAVPLVTTTRAYSLNARTFYGHMLAASASRSFQLIRRMRLTGWLSGVRSPLSPRQAATALHDWPVAALCLSGSADGPRANALLAVGYRPAGQDGRCEYFVRAARR